MVNSGTEQANTFRFDHDKKFVLLRWLCLFHSLIENESASDLMNSNFLFLVLTGLLEVVESGCNWGVSSLEGVISNVMSDDKMSVPIRVERSGRISSSIFGLYVCYQYQVSVQKYNPNELRQWRLRPTTARLA